MRANVLADNMHYYVDITDIKANILNAKIKIVKDKDYQKNVKNFYDLKDCAKYCDFNGERRNINLMSYNSICDYKSHQIIDISICLL